MNRRAFLKSMPLWCSLPQLCTVLGYGSGTGDAVLEEPQFFRWVSYRGGEKQLAFEDLWDPAFQVHCEAVARAIDLSPARRELATRALNLIPSWDLNRARGEREMDWVSFTRQLPAQAPGKHEYLSFLARRYGYRLEAINERYGSRAKHFEDLLSYPFIKVDLQDGRIFEDDSAFLGKLQQKWATNLKRLSHSFPCMKIAQIDENRPVQGPQSRFAIL